MFHASTVALPLARQANPSDDTDIGRGLRPSAL